MLLTQPAPQGKVMPFRYRFPPLEVDILARGSPMKAILRRATIEDAILWERHWQPTLKLNGLIDAAWPFSAHIRRSLPTLLWWRRKYMCLVVECRGLVEAMISLTLDADGENSVERKPIVYVEYLANAPENHPKLVKKDNRRTKGATVQLMMAACILAQQAGIGWVGLDSKQDAVGFYRTIGMTSTRERIIDGVPYEYFEENSAEMVNNIVDYWERRSSSSVAS